MSKNTSIWLVIIVVLAVAGVALWQKEDAVKAPVASVAEQNDSGNLEGLEDGEYTVDTVSSKIGWEGSKTLIVNYFDRGTVGLKNGSFEVRDGVIVSGTFTVDMTSITAISTGRGDGQDRLSTHLKSPDFFGAAKYPTAVFTLTEVKESGQISGDLTIKGITKPVTFSTSVESSGGEARATAEVVLDRTLWDVRYGSGKFFQNLGNNVISDNFKVTLDIAARRN